jgi:hypothetical protein
VRAEDQWRVPVPGARAADPPVRAGDQWRVSVPPRGAGR